MEPWQTGKTAHQQLHRAKNMIRSVEGNGKFSEVQKRREWRPFTITAHQVPDEKKREWEEKLGSLPEKGSNSRDFKNEMRLKLIINSNSEKNIDLKNSNEVAHAKSLSSLQNFSIQRREFPLPSPSVGKLSQSVLHHIVGRLTQAGIWY